MASILDERLTGLADRVDDWMRPYVDVSEPSLRPFYDMMAYHLGWASSDGTALARPVGTGKRMRSMLAMLTCEALGGGIDAARGPAVAVELIHNFSLVHDDIQDRSEYRRGRETVWTLWGAPQAINVGDALFSLAQLSLVEQMGRHPRVAEAVRALNRTCVRLVEGQFLDLHLESAVEITRDGYTEMIARKTAALIECACILGALAADAGDETVAACGRFGHELGLAFQFQDDLLGVWGDPAVTGKPAEADLRSRKKALPLVLALELADSERGQQLRALLGEGGPLQERHVGQMLEIMDALRVRGHAQAMVDTQFEAVERTIAATVPVGRARELLAMCSRLRTRMS